MIKLENISKTYNGKHAVKNVSLEINKGEVFGFVGPNGAGKSTTIKAILNFIFLDSGSITVDGLDSTLDNVNIKKRVGYVPSEVNFYPELTGLELIKIAASFHPIEDDSHINQLCQEFQIDKNKKIKAMSLGNKKKVAIVCALVIQPEILIMDEPTNGLDPLIQQILFKHIKKLTRQGKTAFISSHNLKEVQDHCDRVAFIKNGELLNIADLSEYRQSGKYIKVTGSIHALEQIATKVLSISSNKISFIYDGDKKELFNALAQIKVDDIVIEDISIEHQFIELYKVGGNNHDTITPTA